MQSIIGMATNPKSRFASKKETVSTVYTTQRVKELEGQVAELKKRLEDLRKAKSQTIVKKDKEYVSADAPKLGAQQSSSACTCKDHKALQEKIIEVDTLKDQISHLKDAHAKEMETLRNKTDNDTELLELRKKCSELQEQNESQKNQNKEQQLRIEDLYEQLSKKEAEWCEKEEKLKIELKLSWGEKYQQWMAQTEQKIEELQAANNFLKTLLQRERPRTDGNDN